jgi:hypothetical protein
VAVTGEYLRTINATHPAKFTPLIDAYEKDYPNLQLHAAGWPVPTYLRSIVSMGQPTYGVAGIGPGKSSAGSNLIIAAVTKADPRPVYIVVNAGSNTLAQALQDYRASHSIAETDAFVAKLRVYENGAQDDAGAWINHEFPSIFWIRSKDQTYAYGGPGNTNLGPYVWQPYNNSPQGQDAWADENVRINHGALGALYPHRLLGSTMYYAEGGGTIPWIGLITASLNDTTDKSQLSWGGWSGRFTSQKVTGIFSYHTDVAAAEQAYAPFSVHAEVNDKWTNPASGTVYTGHAAAVWRWREAMWNDFKVRNDWCVMPYSKANHRPVAVLNGNNSKEIIRLQAQTNQTLNLSAAGSSDPDQGAVRYAWWHYQEAGNNPYGKSIFINNPTAQSINFTVPIDAAGKELHLILEVWDSHPTAPLVDYRRAVITVLA